MSNKRAWHFLAADRKLGYGDGRTVVVGEMLAVDIESRDLELCDWGLHWSEDILDALNYAPGLTLSRVEPGGEVLRGDDKGCSSERTAVEIHDVTDIVLAWARWCAQQVLHLWDAPEVVTTFLETGDAAAGAADAAYAAYAARAAGAARAAAYAAARAADAAYAAGAARAAADAAARTTMQDQQRAKLLELLATRFGCLGEE